MMFKLIRKRVNLLKQFLPVMINARRYYFILSLCAVMKTGLSYMTPIFYGIFINNVIVGRNINLIYIVFGGYLFIYLVSTGLEYMQFLTRSKFLNVSLFSFKCKMLNTILYQKISADNLNASELKLRFEDDLGHLNLFIEDQTIDYLLSLVQIVLSLIFIYFINAYLATYAVIIIPVTILFENIVGKKKGKYNEIIRQNQQQKDNWLQKIIYGWRTVKSLNLQKTQMHEYQNYIHIFCENNRKWMNWWILSDRAFPRLKDEFLMRILLYFLGGILISQQSLSIGSLLVFITYYEMLRESVNRFASKDSQLLEAMPHLERLSDVYESIKQNKQITKMSDTKIPKENNVDIKLKSISFRYESTESWLFKNLNLHLTKGDIIAFTGRSGIGKSTLVKLISGIESPTEGVITINGIDIENLSPVILYQNLGIIMQDSILFNATISENLQYSQKVSEEEMIEACRKVCFLDDVANMPNGFNTVIGENGIMLSGGQKQRLVLVRQILRGSKILILDEATSSIDPNTETKIFESIRNLKNTHIIIIVSHRPNPLEICNRFVNFNEDGQVNIL